MVTTGGSSLSGVEALREAGAIVDVMLAIVSFGFDEATTNLDNASVKLHTLTDFSAILDGALTLEKFNTDEETIIRDWFEEPHTWAARHNK